MSKDLHDKIMNIREKRRHLEFDNAHDRILYKEGHRDARHAAAELAIGYGAAPSVASGAPAVESIDCEEFRKLADAYHCVRKQEDVEPTYDALFQYVDKEIERQMRAYGKACAAAERAACAGIADRLHHYHPDTRPHIGDAIRARAALAAAGVEVKP